MPVLMIKIMATENIKSFSYQGYENARANKILFATFSVAIDAALNRLG
jgi:hypothetical protein